MRPGFYPWVRKIPWRKKQQHNPVFLPGEFHGQRSLVGYSPWGHRVGHNWVTFTFFLSLFNQCFAYKHLHSFQTLLVTDRAIVNTVLSIYVLLVVYLWNRFLKVGLLTKSQVKCLYHFTRLTNSLCVGYHHFVFPSTKLLVFSQACVEILSNIRIFSVL